jgi:hypothetical protein
VTPTPAEEVTHGTSCRAAAHVTFDHRYVRHLQPASEDRRSLRERAALCLSRGAGRADQTDRHEKECGEPAREDAASAAQFWYPATAPRLVHVPPPAPEWHFQPGYFFKVIQPLAPLPPLCKTTPLSGPQSARMIRVAFLHRSRLLA